MTPSNPPRDRDGGDDRDGPPAHGPVPLGDLLPGFLRKHGLEGEVEAQEALARWDDVVGPAIARVARPTGVSRGVLFVEVRSSVWMSELNLMRRDILARLNAGPGGGRIRRIVFRIDGGSDHPPTAEETTGR